MLAAAGLVLSAVAVHAEPLPSWNEGAARSAILGFVERVTTPGSPDFVAPEERIAVFDNDGCLWSEQPMYFQLAFAIDRVKSLAHAHPEWKTQQPFQAVLEGDMQSLAASGEHGIVELVMATHAGNTTDEFAEIVRRWLAKARHPRFDQPYTRVVFQPMLELLAYLRENGFQTWIVSGGGVEFLRVFAEQVYGVPPQQVVGSSIVTEYQLRDGRPVLVRQPKLDFLDDKAGKPVGIHKFIGRRPIAAFGNSDGDLQMLQWTTLGDRPGFGLLVHHTDAEREWAYDRKSSFGRLDAALDEATTRGWTVVDMQKDWKVVYPFAH
jgi:phosphoserine phosphatase